MEPLETQSDADLLRLRARIEAELAHRGIAFSVGDLGETLAINHFVSTPGLPNLRLAPKGTKNVDALSMDGDRYSIKTCLKAKKTGTIYPDSKDPEKTLFEYLLVVVLSPGHEMESIHRYSWEKFLIARSWDKRMQAWYVPISAKRLQIAEMIFKLGQPQTGH